MINRNWKAICFILLIVTLLVGCGNEQQSKEGAYLEHAADQATSNSSAPEVSPTGYSEGEAQKADSAAIQRKIIKEADIRQKVTELDPALQLVQQLVDRSGGYIQSSSMHQYREDEREASFVLRVPQAHYSSIIEQLQKIGKSIMITQKGEDVTEQFYDNEARIKNLSLQEEAVQKLLDKADKMEDILRIQQELFRIRGEIETLQGKNRVLDHLASLSTINLTLVEVKAVNYVEDKPWLQAREGFVQSLGGVGDLFVHLMVLLATYLPFIVLIYLPLGILIWCAIRRQKKKTEDKHHT
ncbi:DUF4349 domain-containing protein [Ammoniphilus sp. YIM 78166]|uniref:DUF4349 domain-containing protein n=1 Tax=Ammoniphilus sp. YIM 78166 TaxID=1644106 RepID=UPI001070440F|nr:DUF4349 domain-containing protein [Ammoniphilus sp. YIM 78166]